MPDHHGKPSYNTYARESYEDTYRHARDERWSGADPANLVFCIIMAALIVWLWKRRPDRTFTDDEREAFNRAAQVRKDLEEVQNTVAPKPAPPYLSLTVNKPKD